jgi:MerR family copper efflux transcriptional regulator
VPAKTIRYYEDIGLMPEPPRTSGGYRNYGGGDAARLGFIRAAQSVGLSLGEIREVLAFRDRGEIPCAHVASLIERRAADLTERIAALERMRQDLQRLSKNARTMSPAKAQGAAFCHIIEAGGRWPTRPLHSGTYRSRFAPATSAIRLDQ